MSLYDYSASLDVLDDNPPFYALIMAAMRRADTHNAFLLRQAFPETWAELELRYNAPGGRLPEDEPGERFTPDQTDALLKALRRARGEPDGE